jgi:transcriptional regulator with XRE-family HTH domain
VSVRELEIAGKSPNPIDVYVGRRVRMRRIEIDMSQQNLGEHIGLTFQQIQKYEKGTNRIGASRIQQIGKALEAPVSYFFEGAPDGWEGEATSQISLAQLELLSTPRRKAARRFFRAHYRCQNSAQLCRPHAAGGQPDRQQAAAAEAIEAEKEVKAGDWRTAAAVSGKGSAFRPRLYAAVRGRGDGFRAFRGAR